MNVLRSVALSTNSVQASVEPVIQQVLSLSPMAGQESFGVPLDVHPAHPMMSNTPTTSSMLAALHDSFTNGVLDPSTTSFGADSFGAMSYLDPTGVTEDSMQGVPGIYPDFSANTPFDVSSFTSHDIGMSGPSDVSRLGAEDHHSSPDVKQEKDDISSASSS